MKTETTAAEPSRFNRLLRQSQPSPQDRERFTEPASGPSSTPAESERIAGAALRNARIKAQDEGGNTDPADLRDWPPTGLVLPALLMPEPSMTMAGDAAPPQVAGDIAITGSDPAMHAPVAIADGTATLSPMAPAMASPAAAPLAEAMTSGLPGAAVPASDVGLPAADAAQAESAGKAAPAPQASAPLPLPVPIDTPASDAAFTAQPLPTAFSLFKDSVDALTSGGRRDDPSAAPVAYPLAGLSPVSDTGLARTATVNPLNSLTPDLNTDQFDDTLGTQLSWMADQKIGHAHIRIHPSELGAVEVSLRLEGDQVHADFSSAQPEVRQALENSLPRLREMLGQQGFQLAQADVGHRQHPQSSASAPIERSGSGDAAAGSDAQLPPVTVRTLRGLLDAYA